MSEKSVRRNSDHRELILELVIFAAIIPFVIYGLLSLGSPPVA